MAIRLYPPYIDQGSLSFAGVKRCTVPNQSLSLREIVRRFVRRESLPMLKDGYYEERFGDLEKISRDDIVTKYEKIDELKAQIKQFEERYQKQQAAKAAAAQSLPNKVGEPANQPPPLQGS